VTDSPSLEVSPAEALDLLSRGEAVLLDVREVEEWRAVRVPGAVHIPLGELPLRLHELGRHPRLLVLCAHGIRSAAATEWLREAGHPGASNVRHGLSRWEGPVEFG
jgi:rhodanese-related sulfurtransferase